MVKSSRIGEERALFRAEVFKYQKTRFYGIPVNGKPLSSVWLLVPTAALLLLYYAFLTSTYQPRVSARLSQQQGAGTVVVSVAARQELLEGIGPGDEVRLELEGGQRSYPLRVSGKSRGACALGPGCTQVEGRIVGVTADSEIHLPRTAEAALVLPPRAVLEWHQ
ncbi:hypothetical protein CYFUS_004642 [Cystobacter fuscus]|uniref:Uncharacterized protein n=1 Tax=Cystobacter fuscus TaxID=43 RepID=A0A250J712_9BACT|nr:hypothetical protein [Cystobacter fuscus]ATB39201.1 hypothetical protein CYFUS_004642 [Cystobacter fuscus]